MNVKSPIMRKPRWPAEINSSHDEWSHHVPASTCGGAGYYQGTGLNLYGSSKHLGFTGKPLQQDQLHVVTEEGGGPLHHLAAQ